MSFKDIFYCTGSSPSGCSILSAGNAAGDCKEKLWDLHVAAEREMSELNYQSAYAIFLTNTCLLISVHMWSPSPYH